ncbi:MAG: peptidylprolyl isomerase [Candidatus Coatesbacteria bacterium]|nr:MAG: peptidylprolyl isomerase [Candidatus Coatesbacteria bacterium]
MVKIATSFPFIALVLAGVITAQPATAELIPIDGTVAIVNDDIILGSEVGEQVQFLLSQVDPAMVEEAGGVAALTGSVLSDMVDSRLLLQRADELDIAVAKEEVDALAEENLAAFRANFASDGEFAAALAEFGITEKSLMKYYKKNIREQMTIRQLIDQEIYPKIEIDENEARNFFESHKSEFAVPTLVDISEIVVAKKPTENSATVVRTLAFDLKRRAEAGADFGDLAREYSAAANASSGGEFSFKPGETYPELEAAVAVLVPGRVSQPIEMTDGYWLVELVGFDGETYVTRTIFLPISVTDADVSAARTKIERAYEALERGVSFENVAEEYSEEESTAGAGGRVGELGLAALARDFPIITAELEYMEPGDFTSVVEREEGFYIIRLNGREEGYARGYEDAREQVIDVLRSERVEDELSDYIQDIKEKSYIKTFQ